MWQWIINNYYYTIFLLYLSYTSNNSLSIGIDQERLAKTNSIAINNNEILIIILL